MVNIWSFFTQLIGGSCALCGAPADGLCEACLAALPRNLRPCARCALPLPVDAPDATLCGACQVHAPTFGHAVAPLVYRPPVDHLIAAFKYRQQLALGPVLAAVLADALRDHPERPQLLLPVPATPARLRERGFNQAAELARDLSARLDIPWAAGRLHRTRVAVPQRGLGRQQRLRNLRGVFDCTGTLPPHVALIDDVMTTGATAEAACRALRDSGVVRVAVWTVARTPLGGHF